MKAYVLKGINDLRYENADMPECPEGWALVRVAACGICSSDIPRIFTNGTYHFPTIPGHELSGTVAEVGCSSDEAYVGKRVSVFPLIPCRKCAQCISGHYEMCENYDYIGSRRDGGFAEYAAVPVWNLLEIPDSIDFESAAMFEPLSVAYHALKQGKMKKNGSVCIVGTGMIAFAAAQIANAVGGSEVVVVGRNNDKKKICDKLNGIEYSVGIPTDKNFDIVLEAVGSAQSVSEAITAVRPGGTLVLMGNPYSDITLEQNVYWRILRKQLNVVGTWNSSFEKDKECDWSAVRELLIKGKINTNLLISHRFDKEHLTEGLSIMKTRSEPYCKIMTVWDS